MKYLFAVFCFCFLHLQAKIYDCFTFFNELELLEVRLNELYDHVDKFVLVESVETFRGKEKPFYYKENKERFRKFADKIIHIVLTERVDTENPWDRESFQRQQIMRGLSECQPDDVIIISDLDEIVRAAALPSIIHALQAEKKDIVGCTLTLYRFFLNAHDLVPWRGPIVSTYGYLTKNNVHLSQARLDHHGWMKYTIIENAGWHFSWMGGAKRVVQKIESYSHQEEDVDRNKTPSYINDQLRQYNCKIAKFDESYPRYILENLNYFSQIHWIYPKYKQNPAYYLKDRIQPENHRYHTFQKALTLLNEREAKICVETGTARFGDKNFALDGGSTIIFGHWAEENEAVFHSVDINGSNINEARMASKPYSSSVKFVESDSIAYLKSFPEKIDFLYLDSFDYDYTNPLPSQKHHLEEIKAALPHLTDKSIIMIDDCNLENGGKGFLVIPFLIEQGWKVIENQYQVLLIKEEKERTKFDLAQIYKSLKYYPEAIQCYKKCIEARGDLEEGWFSRYQLGECYDAKGEWDQAFCWYLEAYQCDPNRRDPLTKIAQHYRHSGQYDLAYLFAKQGGDIPPVDHARYKFFPMEDYQVFEELSISAFYTQFKDDGLMAANELVLQKGVAQHVKNCAYENMVFYTKPLKNARYVAILPETTNPSIQKTENGYQVICRAVHCKDQTVYSKNYLVNYDRNFCLLSQSEITEKLPRDRIRAAYGGFYFEGPEDCRLISLGKKSCFTCSLQDTHPSGIPKIAFCELDKKSNVKRLIPLQGPDSGRAERDWLPFVKDGELHLIYSFHPFILYKPNLKTGSCETVERYITDDAFTFHGSAGPIPFDEGYLVVVHEYPSNEKPIYYHRFVYLDKNFMIKRMSLPFVFKHHGMEMCAGMTMDHSGKEVVLTLGIENQEAYFCFLDLPTIRSLLQPR